MAEVNFLPVASSDYDDAFNWYFSRSESAAEGVEEAVEPAITEIVKAPDRWPLCDNRHRQHLLKRYPFSLVYRLAGDTVLIVAVAHARRQFGYWRQQE
ncbi:MAG: type II toxin-antitoxin system RelE/ParE family toxin [Planctomyces sp.]